MIYTDLNYDNFFSKPQQGLPEYSDSDFDLLVQAISAGKITEGISQSKNLKIDYDEGQIVRFEGATSRLEIGKFSDGKFGMRVYDASGTTTIDNTS